MQRPEPKLSELALADLEAVFDAVLETSRSVDIASGIYEGVLEAIQKAAPMPLAAPSVQGITGIACDYRWVQFKGWMAFFHVESDGGMIVDRVLWGKSRWAKHLGIDNDTD